MFEINSFICEHITKRDISLFSDDLKKHQQELEKGIANKCVLVIGGAGSIGTAFIKTMLPYKPSEIVVVELTRFLRSDAKLSKLVPNSFLTYPMDYDSVSFRRMFKHHQRSTGNKGFDIVANFSAHKHVRSEKDIYSVEALLRNNVINAKGLLDFLEGCPPEVYFCVSTDKAANPVNIMGASKRIMEDIIFSYSDSFQVKTARFANVAFSNGSLPDGYLKRIDLLQPISAPTNTMRYFVSPKEAGEICMISTILGGNREVLFPKLSDKSMMTFDRIAVELLDAYGYNAIKCNSNEEAIDRACELKNGSRDYPVYFSASDTNGEKEYEEFFTNEEQVDMERFISLGVVTGKKMTERKKVEELIYSLEEAFDTDVGKEAIVEVLQSYLPSFKHIETGRNLDEKM